MESAEKKYPHIDFSCSEKLEITIENIRSKIKELTDKKILNDDFLLHGCTLDKLASIVSCLNDKTHYVHAFLDEACYCCTAKSTLLFYLHCPVTYFGDHMQLPPVSEVDDQEFYTEESEPMFLWSLNGIYASDLFQLDFHKMYLKYTKNNEEPPSQLTIVHLNETHRFGKELAEVLDRYVYHMGFHSVLDTETDIKIIDAPKRTPNYKKRENYDEAEAIKEYLEKKIIDEFVILTPYLNQAQLLKKHIYKSRENVLTVHKSQGQEWDTVILSVSDTTNKFFTDINNSFSQGRKLLNTAISRSKRELIIVCDVSYWKSVDDQLITELINIGEIIN